MTELSGLEIFDRVAYGHVVFHRDRDAWDLIDDDGLVAAVLCPRQHHLSTAPVSGERLEPKPVGRRIPYGEKVEHKIRSEDIDHGISILRDLAKSERS